MTCLHFVTVAVMMLQLIYYNAYLQYCSMILKDLFLDITDILIFLSIKVNCSPCLVYLHKIMDQLFSPLQFKAYFCLP